METFSGLLTRNHKKKELQKIRKMWFHVINFVSANHIFFMTTSPTIPCNMLPFTRNGKNGKVFFVFFFLPLPYFHHKWCWVVFVLFFSQLKMMQTKEAFLLLAKGSGKFLLSLMYECMQWVSNWYDIKIISESEL